MLNEKETTTMKYDSELFGSLFGLIGAFLIAIGMPIGFYSFLVSNLFFINMGIQKKMRPFLVLQGAFTLTSLLGIYNTL